MSHVVVSEAIGLLQVAVLLCAAFICGEVAVRCKQPALIGQLVAGILLGPSVMGSIFPTLETWLFPPPPVKFELVEALGGIGLIFLLALTGMEMDVELIRRQGRAVAFIGVLGCLIPFAGGMLAAILIPDQLLGTVKDRTLLMLFIGVMFSMSSLPIVARLLSEMGLSNSKCGQLIVTSALLHDATGYVFIGAVAALAAHLLPGADGMVRNGGGEAIFGSMAVPVNAAVVAPLGTLLFLLILFFTRKAIFAGFRRVGYRAQTEFALLTMLSSLALLGAAVTQYIGVHVALAAGGAELAQ